MYLEHHAQDMAHLHACLEAGDRQEADRISHAIKGAAGTLGAQRVHALATDLNRAIREGRSDDEIARALAALEDTHQQFLDGIRALPAPASSAPVAIDWEEVRRVLARLEALLSVSDIDADTVMRASAPLLLKALGEPARALQRLIEGFDFEQALAALQTLKQQVPPADGLPPQP